MPRQLFQYDPIIGYRFIPGLKARVEHEGGGYLVRVNQAGFRCDREFEEEKDPAEFRVLLFGDSYTAGDGVSNKHRYGDQLEEMLPGITVYNFGLSGTGTDQQYLIFREAAKLEYDLVIVGVLVENIRRVVARYRPYESDSGDILLAAKPYYSLDDDGDLHLHQVPVPDEPIVPEHLPETERRHVDSGGGYEWLRHLASRFGPRVKNHLQRISRYQPLPAYDRGDDPAWLLLKAILLHWTEEANSPVVIVPIPLYHYIEGTSSPVAYQRRFDELREANNVEVHDPLPDFMEYAAGERRAFRFAKDCHLTPAGHQVLASSLVPVVKRAIEDRGR
jgi:lysophospholipase L1-like esterase